MFKVKNDRTGKFIKDAITTQVRIFDTIEHAQSVAAAKMRESVLNATAWNRVRKATYSVVPA